MALTRSVHPFKGDTVVTGEDSHMNTHSKKEPMTFNFMIQIKRPLGNHETATCLLWLPHCLHKLAS